MEKKAEYVGGAKGITRKKVKLFCKVQKVSCQHGTRAVGWGLGGELILLHPHLDKGGKKSNTKKLYVVIDTS